MGHLADQRRVSSCSSPTLLRSRGARFASRRRAPEHHRRTLRRRPAARRVQDRHELRHLRPEHVGGGHGDEAGTTVVIGDIAKRQSVGGRDSARIRKIASEILSDLEARLFRRRSSIPSPARRSPSRGHRGARASVGEEIESCAVARSRLITTEEFEEYKRRLLERRGEDDVCFPGPTPAVRDRRPASATPLVRAERHAARCRPRIFLRTMGEVHMPDADEIRAAQREMWGKFFPQGGRSGTTSSSAAIGEVGEAVIAALQITEDQQHLEVAAGTGEPGLTDALRPRPEGSRDAHRHHARDARRLRSAGQRRRGSPMSPTKSADAEDLPTPMRASRRRATADSASCSSPTSRRRWNEFTPSADAGRPGQPLFGVGRARRSMSGRRSQAQRSRPRCRCLAPDPDAPGMYCCRAARCNQHALRGGRTA